MTDTVAVKSPRWFSDLYENRFDNGTAHAFGLHGNVADVMAPGIPTMRAFLSLALAPSFPIVAFFDIAHGVTFADEVVKIASSAGRPAMRQLFQTVLKIGGGSGNSAMSAMRGGQTPDVELGNDPAMILGLLDKLLHDKAVQERQEKTGVRCAVIIDHAEMLVPAVDKALKPLAERQALVLTQTWGSDPDVVNSGNIIILITEQLADIHGDLKSAASRYAWIAVPLPDEEEREAFLTFWLEQIKVQAEEKESPPLTLAGDLTVREVAALCAGLQRAAMEDILLAARATETSEITREAVKMRKKEIIGQEFSDQIEFLDVDGGFETVGGLEYVKSYLAKRVIKPIRAGRYASVPKGLLLLGGPGLGKSYLVATLAKESGFNAIQFRPDKILGKYVGQSEQNLERVLTVTQALAPCYLFIDEIDQRVSRGEGGGGGGGQVNSNIFGRILEFVANPKNRGRVILVAASNRPDLLDPALIRAGRIEVKIPFLPPDLPDRLSILAVHARKLGIDLGTEAEPVLALTQQLEGWTGAEIERLTVKAKSLAEDDEVPPCLEHVRLALTYTISKVGEYQQYNDLALAFTDDLELLPPEFRSLAQNAPRRIQEEFGRENRPRRLQ